LPDDETPTPRPPTGSTIRIRIEVIDREEGSFTNVEAAVAEVTERVAQADTGDRYAPVLPTVESVAREAINKTLAQLVANEARMAARES
jgi:hypothetical protein